MMSLKVMMEYVWQRGGCESPLEPAQWTDVTLEMVFDRLQLSPQSSISVLPDDRLFPPLPVFLDLKTTAPRANGSGKPDQQ